MVSWRAGAVYKPRPNGSVYAGYGTSFNPSAEGLALTPATVNLEPEKSPHLRDRDEVGRGAEPCCRSPPRSSAPTRPTRARPVSTPAIRRRCSRANSACRASSSARRAGSATGPRSPTTPSCRATSSQSNTALEVDNALALTPEHTFNLWTTYALPWRHHGGRRRAVHGRVSSATRPTPRRSRATGWSTRCVSYDVNEHLTLRLNGNNLADEDYVDRVGGGHYIPGPRRSVHAHRWIPFLSRCCCRFRSC